MTAVTNPACSFVNMVVTTYDKICHKGCPNIQDIFNPGLEEGLKESSLELYSEKLKSAGLGFDYAEFDANIVASYKEAAPTLSRLFALAGILDGPSQDTDQKKAKFLDRTRSLIIEALAQDHLRNKKTYTLDPIGSVLHSIHLPMVEITGKTSPLSKFANGKRHFFAQIFQEVFSRCSVNSKKKIIQRLSQFAPILNTRSARLQRVVFKVEGTFNYYLTNRYVKFGVSIIFRYASYHAVKKTMALVGQAFTSGPLIALSSAAVARMPVFVIQMFNKVYTRVMEVAAYVATTRVYGKLANLEKWEIIVICGLVPAIGWVYVPFFTFAGRVQLFCYERLFGPDARTQVAISESLKKCKEKEKQELLDGGMKAYQVWMYLMERGGLGKAFH
ncbi:MAG TPA: hypothetical protein VHK67_02005 [Rhabdochlamydiaceae bacterium]|jgi:hypothetical protein|nr:hypothetical protein [Rhabdochlamydiaceae bacterium]